MSLNKLMEAGGWMGWIGYLLELTDEYTERKLRESLNLYFRMTVPCL